MWVRDAIAPHIGALGRNTGRIVGCARGGARRSWRTRPPGCPRGFSRLRASRDDRVYIVTRFSHVVQCLRGSLMWLSDGG